MHFYDSSQIPLSTNKRIIIPQDIGNLAKNNGICVECKNPNTGFTWCNNCDAKTAEEKLVSSGNDIIDNFIKNHVKKANDYEEYWEWIPSERIEDIGIINNIFMGTWLAGEKILIDQNDAFTKARTAVDYFCRIVPGSENYFPRTCMISLPNFKRLIDLQVETQNELIKHISKSGSFSNEPLAKQIKEMAFKDLLRVVEYSNLDSAPILTVYLKKFIDWDHKINKNLRELQIQSQASLSMLYIRYSLTKLEDMRDETLTPRHLKVIDRIFRRLIVATDNHLKKLITSTNDILLGVLNSQAIQSEIANIVEKEKDIIVKDHNKVISELWSIFDGQINTIIFDRNLKLLEEFDDRKKLMVDSIMNIKHQLKLFETQLNVLSSGIDKPLLVDIPFELHLASMKNALLLLSNWKK
ncbi:16153_t:CDS:2 [Entrophospora sp. SA101]|nr:11566_t:CDS:2 [Entrophospora sp. SA101]CAJ0761293.1 16153_t:CDS:2 [Entrophospora sp. SA101]CAJ0893709.1 3644_t:CDS:2 [Entrophospora sp. SA101]CAJ0911097.1 10439_t:CDS:2 [Entrophospora sp. SA101]